MSLLGNGALMIWHDIAPGCETEYEEWHSKEHILERVAVPGFLRGHRGRAVSGSPQYINWYEVDDVAVLTSTSYLDRLNNPSAWTQQALGHFRGNNRTLCRVIASAGSGICGHLMSIQLAAAAAHGAKLADWLCATSKELLKQHGVIAAHYLEGDLEASRIDTEEKRLREGGDAVTDRVMLIGGYDADALRGLRQGLLSSATLQEHGAQPGDKAAVYRLQHCITKADL